MPPNFFSSSLSSVKAKVVNESSGKCPLREEGSLYQLSDDVLLKKVGTFVTAMENQKNIKRG